MRRPALLLVLLSAALALPFLLGRAPGTAAAAYGLPLDDGWIHLVYARSLAHLDGFAYNPGTAAAGFTSPLWVLLLAPVEALKPLWGGEAVYGVKLVGVLVAAAASLLAHRLVLRLTGRRAAAWGAALLLALDPGLAFARVSGMEVHLAAAVVLLFLVALAEERLALAAVALALAPLARPENLLLLPLGGAALALGLARRRARPVAWLGAAAPALLALGAWAAYCLVVTGRPLPSTYYAKHATGGASVAIAARLVADLSWMRLGAGGVLAAGGAALLLGAAPRPRRAADLAVRLLVVGYPVAVAAGVVAVHDLQQAAPFYWARYLLPAVALLAVPAGAGAGAVAAAGIAAARGPGRARLVAVGAAALLAVAAAGVPRALAAQVERYAWNCQNVEEMNVAVGRWLAAHAAPGDVVATQDAGAVRYFSGRRTLDLLGLNSPEVLAVGRVAAIRAAAPRYLVVFPATFPGLERSPAYVRVATARASRYTICACPTDELVVYQAR